MAGEGGGIIGTFVGEDERLAGRCGDISCRNLNSEFRVAVVGNNLFASICFRAR